MASKKVVPTKNAKETKKVSKKEQEARISAMQEGRAAKKEFWGTLIAFVPEEHKGKEIQKLYNSLQETGTKIGLTCAWRVMENLADGVAYLFRLSKPGKVCKTCGGSDYAEVVLAHDAKQPFDNESFAWFVASNLVQAEIDLAHKGQQDEAKQAKQETSQKVKEEAKRVKDEAKQAKQTLATEGKALQSKVKELTSKAKELTKATQADGIKKAEKVKLTKELAKVQKDLALATTELATAREAYASMTTKKAAA